ncbi:MAG: glycosyltransferase [Pseudomonadota bacterium]
MNSPSQRDTDLRDASQRDPKLSNQDANGARRVINRIAIYAGDARVFPEELSGLVKRLVARGVRIRCFAPAWSDTVAKLTIGDGAETDTYALTTDDKWQLLPGRALRKQTAETVTAWNPDVVMAIGPACALQILPAVPRNTADRIAVLDRWADAATAPPSVEASRVLRPRDVRALHAAADTVICHHEPAATTFAAASRSSDRNPPRILTINGFGVSAEHVPANTQATSQPTVRFLLTAPLDEVKGVRDYAQAAALALARTQAAASTDGTNQPGNTTAPAISFALQAAPGRTSRPVALDELTAVAPLAVLDPAITLTSAIADHDVIVFAAHHDGMPRELLTTLAVGRAIVASAIPAAKLAIDERVNGCLFTAGNAEALAHACLSMAKHPQLLPAMGRASRRKAERRFSSDTIVRAYLTAIGL